MEQSSQTPNPADSSIGTTPTPGSTVQDAGVLVSQPTQATPTPVPPAPPSVPAEALPELDAKRKNQSLAWEHFTRMKNPDGSQMARPRAKCNYCPQTYACHSKANGTTAMRTHMLYQCRKSPLYIPAKKQRYLTFDSQENGGHVLSIAYDKDDCRFACARMIIRDELPFSHVEGQGFIDFMRFAQPKFKPPSRRTIARDILILYKSEKHKIKEFLARNEQRRSLGSVLQRKDEYKGGIVPLDVCTRWNSTYFMLEIAMKFKKAFVRLLDEDQQFEGYFEERIGGKKRDGPPSNDDWDKAARLIKFLKIFYDATLHFSGTKVVTANQPLLWMCTIVGELEKCTSSSDPLMVSIGTSMKIKFDKYWLKLQDMNKYC
ncbi:hypothetical protein M0R45_034630 [Rubus argutus]|uniref:BED-type domain-containing protein n=1 Tax=Rubus argutus TaxID=59490 RepID=A0AAW1VQR8_RUBAR